MSLILDQRATNSKEKITAKKAIMFGIVTGLYAALFGSFLDIFITLITKNNDIILTFPELQRMINGFPVTPEIKAEVLNLFQNVREEILTKGFSLLYTFSVLVNNLVVNTIFGAVGGLVGAQIINNRINNPSN